MGLLSSLQFQPTLNFSALGSSSFRPATPAHPVKSAKDDRALMPPPPAANARKNSPSSRVTANGSGASSNTNGTGGSAKGKWKAHDPIVVDDEGGEEMREGRQGRSCETQLTTDTRYDM